MKVIKKFVTNSSCYKAGKTIIPKGIMLHSVGCNQPSALVFVNTWNTIGHTVCAHGIVDGNTGDCYQTLPFNHRGWHAGGAANNTHIGLEMCEPSCLKYKKNSASFTCSDPAAARAVVKRTYDSAVEWCAQICEEFNFDPTADGVIISHKEGGKRGVASGHLDPEHLWTGLNMGYTMDGFRKDVKAAMNKQHSNTTIDDDVLYRVQVGAFKVKLFANNYLAKVRAAGFDAVVIKVGNMYKIQVGAFRNKSNAEAFALKLKYRGFDAIIVSAIDNNVVSELKLGDKVKMQKGAPLYGKTSKFQSWVYNSTLYVRYIKGNRVVISTNRTGDITGAVDKKYLTKI